MDRDQGPELGQVVLVQRGDGADNVGQPKRRVCRCECRARATFEWQALWQGRCCAPCTATVEGAARRARYCGGA